jgi:predicted metallopeptidase
MRSNLSSSRAYARIWGLSKVWQMALSQKPAYIIEVLSQHFDKLTDKDKDKVLLHELAHIPKNFSGSLLAHIRHRGKRNFHDRVEELFSQYLRKIKY